MNTVIVILIFTNAASALLNCKLIDILHKIDANEELMEENEALRQQLDDLRRQNDFVIGRM